MSGTNNPPGAQYYIVVEGFAHNEGQAEVSILCDEEDTGMLTFLLWYVS